MGKVFRTINGGITWTACADLPGAMNVYSLIVDADTLYASTYPNGDVFKSIDRGNSWINTANLPGITSARTLVRLQNGDILVGTSPYDVTNRNRIYRTTDGGSSWVLTGLLPHINPCKFIYQTTNGAIYTGGFGIDSETIIHKSVDNGVTWDALTVIPQFECHSDADGFYETKNGVLYVTGYIPSHGVREGAGYVYKSLDQGVTWESCTKIVRGDSVNSGRIYSIVDDAYGTLYVGMQPAPDSVVYASSDRGRTWYSTGGLEGTFECLCLLRRSDGTIYAGTTPNGDVFKYNPPTRIVEKTFDVPMTFELYQNYPNPFNSTTTICFQLPSRSRVKIDVYDILGQFINTLIDKNFQAGWHDLQFTAINKSGHQLSSGVYYYRLEADGFLGMKKCILLN
jgi:hypothetical protein